MWVVTGGASGIGSVLVGSLVERGHAVVSWDRQPAAEPAAGADYLTFDLTEAGAIERAAQALPPDVSCFAHCAGAGFLSSVSDDDAVRKLREAHELHAVAFLRGVLALRSRLESSRGCAVAVTSAAEELVYPTTLAYGTSKAALSRLVRQLAVELGPTGIRVNGVAPGAIATPISREMWADPEFAAERSRSIPLGGQGQPADIAEAIQYLASDRASYITGHVLWVDGGVRSGIFAAGTQEYARTRPVPGG